MADYATDTLLGAWRTRMREEIEHCRDALAGGRWETAEKAREYVGRAAGLERALQVMTEVRQKSVIDEDLDDN